MEIIPINDKYKSAAESLIAAEWGSKYVVTKGRMYDCTKLPAYIALKNNQLAGLITYFISDDECEIITLNSLAENQGIGKMLIDKVIETARNKNCSCMLVITTNDNTRAIRYYQKSGFILKAVHINAIEHSRVLKPEIPLLGIDGIPILHEFEFRLEL